jgi:hypothetical protein
MPMSYPPGLTHNGSIPVGNTACPLAHRRRRCSIGDQNQELIPPRINTIPWRQTRRVATGNGRPRCGDREQPFPPQPTRDKRRHTPLAVPRCPQPATTQQRATQRRVITVLTRKSDVNCGR